MIRTALRKTFSFPVLLGVLLAGGTFLGSCHGLPDPDVFLHLAVGRDILAAGTWPTTDSYSFIAYGNDCLAYEWLGQVLLALVARAGGLRGLTALLVALSAILVVLLYCYAWQRCGNPKAAFVACLAVLPLAVPFFRLRPQLLGYAFLLITLICLERFHQCRRTALWPLPVLFLLWANTHGTFVLGFFVLGLHWVGGLTDLHWGGLEAVRWTPQQRRQLEFIGLLCLLALTITPYGTRLAAFPVEYVLHSPLGVIYINEYLPLSGVMLELTLFLLLFFLLAQVALRPTWRLQEMLFLLFAVYAAFLHFRLALLLILAFTPLLAVLLARWVPNYSPAKDRYALNAALMVLIAAGLVQLFPSEKGLEGDVAQSFPCRAVDYLRRHPIAGPMLNPDGWGGYLMWRMGRGHRVFIDTRSQLYEVGGVVSDYLSIMGLGSDALPLLRKYGIEACLIGRTAPLATLLATSPDWDRIYKDDIAVILIRKKSALTDR